MSILVSKNRLNVAELRELLDVAVEMFNGPEFIAEDPISIPHRFRSREDIEIAGFFAAIFAWGQRKTIIGKAKELLELMDNDPYQFILHHLPSDLRRLAGFKHRTFQPPDLIYFITTLRALYIKYHTLEDLFIPEASAETVESGLARFHEVFFSYPGLLPRSKKHLATPVSGSTCKRMAMYLRWMVRRDDSGVDFGIWTRIQQAQLVCPLDVHVDRVARGLGLLKHKRLDWNAVLELTRNLKTLDPADPIKYDFALFGIGVTG